MLKLFLSGKKLTIEDIAMATGAEIEKIELNLTSMIKEGFIRETKGAFKLKGWLFQKKVYTVGYE